MSTSTITSLMTHCYYTMSNFKSPHFVGLSEPYDNEPLKFMVSQRKPSTVFLNKVKPGVFSVDGDSGFMSEPSNLVLLKMGKYMENILTTEVDEFISKFIL